MRERSEREKDAAPLSSFVERASTSQPDSNREVYVLRVLINDCM
jgi:hypothetical protein